MFEETHYMSSCTYVNLDKLMRYGEISKNKELQDTYGLSEAKFIALNQYLKENNEETTFTISCEGLPPCSIGDVVGTEMYRRELTNLYNVSSMAINIDRKKRPIIQTELGLGDIDRAIKVNETLEAQRKQLHSLSKDSIYPRYTGKDEKLWSD